MHTRPPPPMASKMEYIYGRTWSVIDNRKWAWLVTRTCVKQTTNNATRRPAHRTSHACESRGTVVANEAMLSSTLRDLATRRALDLRRRQTLRAPGLLLLPPVVGGKAGHGKFLRLSVQATLVQSECTQYLWATTESTWAAVAARMTQIVCLHACYECGAPSSPRASLASPICPREAVP